jgi:hypothetical protein
MTSKSQLDNYFFAQKKLKTHYKSLTLISHIRHIKKITKDKKDTLVVTTDWLLLKDLLNDGYEAIYFEYGLNDEEEDELERKLYIKSNDWLYVNGIDHTLYKNVSVGKLFSRDISLILLSHKRITKSLSKLCAEFTPETIYFYDYRSEFEVLDTDEKLVILEDFCSSMDIHFVDKNDCPDAEDKNFPQHKIYGLKSIETKKFSLLRNVYGNTLELFSQIIELTSAAKEKVVIQTGGHLAQVLNAEYTKKSDFKPILFSSGLKKSPLTLLKSLIKGVYLSKDISHKSTKLNKEPLEKICEYYLTYWEQKKGSVVVTRIIQNYVKKNIFYSDRIEDYCRLIDASFDFYNKHKPKKILLDSVFSAESRISMDIAKQNSIKVEYIWHGFWQHVIDFDALGGDVRSKVKVDRVYTWGAQNERWLDAIKWKGENVRVGNPFASKYVKQENDHSQNNTPKKGKKNILLLQYTPMNTDVKGLNANQYGYFVDMVRYFNEQLDCSIRLKLHPGVWKKSYYEKIKDYFNLNCEIRDDGPFEKHVKWADLIIGPVQSGAFLEVLASGKYYYPVLLPPQAKMVDIKSGKVYQSLSELTKDLTQEKRYKQNQMLEDLISFSEFDNPAKSLINMLSK